MIRQQQSLINYSIQNAIILQNLQFQVGVWLPFLVPSNLKKILKKIFEKIFKPLIKQLRQNQKLPYQMKENDIIRPDAKKVSPFLTLVLYVFQSVKLRSFLIDDILDNDFSTPLNALEQLTCK